MQLSTSWSPTPDSGEEGGLAAKGPSLPEWTGPAWYSLGGGILGTRQLQLPSTS